MVYLACIFDPVPCPDRLLGQGLNEGTSRPTRTALGRVDVPGAWWSAGGDVRRTGLASPQFPPAPEALVGNGSPWAGVLRETVLLQVEGFSPAAVSGPGPRLMSSNPCPAAPKKTQRWVAMAADKKKLFFGGVGLFHSLGPCRPFARAPRSNLKITSLGHFKPI